ncbi:selenocysteine-specific translation elongation factor [Geobacter sp. DSM 9736]|uniref:selenocysteine-specific translation elongation factor n=1 Tax=Geobacter sp. DSM 9736 TaxID=1277350 RepID=UPI000B503C45|nr:selenocysteine-specific translation elongation factor [Geobacter sp. DSM 9736]SNB47249.1 selenocysteine-specific translation elongation factor SelB [Geobacter sp. DSM 9736]
MKHLILGTAGHIDHGKTSLVKTLTGIDTDRLPEEKARGITIELGFAHLSLPGGIEIGIVDVPGHERFVRTMVAGVGGMDLVMLVIAADEGIMPQTREHLEICQLLGVKRGVVALTKSDLVDADWLALAGEEVADYLSGTFLEGARIIPVSSRTGEGIDALKVELARLCAEVEEKKAAGRFRLPVDRVFTVPGFGTVVTGTLLSGEVRVGDEVELLPLHREGRVRGVQTHGMKSDVASAGQRVAVNLQGVEHTEVSRGDIVVPRGIYHPTWTVDTRLHYLPSAPRELRHRATLRLHSATYEVPAQVILLDRDSLKPGETAFAQLRLGSSALLLPGDPFVLRSYSPQATLGGGRVLDPAPPRRRRRNEDALALLAALDEGDEADRVLFLVREALLSGISLEELSQRSGLPIRRLDVLLAELLSKGSVVQVVREPRIFMTRPTFDSLKEFISSELATYLRENPLRNGMGKEELKSRIPKRADSRFFGPLLAALEKEGKVAVERDLVKATTGEKPSDNGSRLSVPLQAALRKAGIEPPTVKELAEAVKAKEKEVLDHLHLLVREGKSVKVKNDLFYAPESLALLREKLVGFLKEKKEITPGEFRELTGLSRKFMIPVLEYFDQEKVTIRVGDKRALRRG